MTNFEKITKDPETLAPLLSCCEINCNCIDCGEDNGMTCEERIEDWLKQETPKKHTNRDVMIPKIKESLQKEIDALDTMDTLKIADVVCDYFIGCDNCPTNNSWRCVDELAEWLDMEVEE